MPSPGPEYIKKREREIQMNKEIRQNCTFQVLQLELSSPSMIPK